MPSTYAHYRMGQEIREALDGKEREIVDTFPSFFKSDCTDRISCSIINRFLKMK